MESEGHPKCSRSTNQAHFSSTSVKDSILTIPVLPAELITETLLRLPVKSLLKFRSVSKSWLALISSPEFIKTHLTVSANNNRLIWSSGRGLNIEDCNFSSLFNESVTEVFDLDYRMIYDGLYNELPLSVTILSSVNGLICLVDEKYDLFLWNPSNRKYKKLPYFKSTMWFEQYRTHGFGYDEFHDDYKVLGAFCSYGKFDRGELKIYSLKSDSWESVDDCQLRKCKSRGDLSVPGKFVKGKLHWCNAKVDGLHIENKEWKIISFDLANEKWGEVEHPCYKEGYIALFLGVLGSDLSIFCDNVGSHVDFWVMKEYGVKESWTKMCTINYPSYKVGYGFFLPSFMSNQGEIFVRFVTTSMVYNPKDASLRYSEVIDFDDIRKIEIYVESLVCPFSREVAADATKHRRLKKLRSRKPKYEVKKLC